MPKSIDDLEVQNTLNKVRSAVLNRETKRVKVGDKVEEIHYPFPSPEDWRDQWIYFIMVDRFNNPEAEPKQKWDSPSEDFQGGTFEGIRQQLGYLKELGVGALWLTPVQKNCQYQKTYYGYGIQDFLQIDKRFASDQNNPEKELQALIDEAHARDIYVIFDIVLNHAGNVFAYIDPNGKDGELPFRDAGEYDIQWRDQSGNPNKNWQNPPTDDNLPSDAAIWPKELCNNNFFRRKGNRKDTEYGGDFGTLKEFVTDNPKVRNILICIHQYLIAKYDIDGFRLDALKHIEPEFARIFGNAMREFALSIGKKNFFTFGEVADESEEKLAKFTGRYTQDKDDLMGVDAALDFPVFHKLPKIAKGFMSPSKVVDIYERRKEVQRNVISSHGEASRFFVTFLDNHDQDHRFYYSDSTDPDKYNDQATLGIACLFALQGIPCLYYGTEQGLNGSGNSDRAVRQALWGKPDAFNPNHQFYQTINKLSHIRDLYPALRYGRQYFRPISGDNINFSISTLSPGVLVFSRILNDQEVVVVANTNQERSETVYVIVDFNINPENSTYNLAYSNKTYLTAPRYQVETKNKGEAKITEVNEVNAHINDNLIRVMKVTLQPMEVQILATNRRK
ncbi:alpha-amylase family glycosyl hydrolase [Nostoc sp. FACHB-133]|uniref:alpha-amylase family glycosyl hydrolase n=1 Tax=Nostoc sp. FACHB-133 TaxID=2692835 RepID=UPI001685E90A|nr:alpha-amylase family glycosyl hydrolase [Nostoc sp. FACHB-133]MBD2526660.1 hypothetical protein [Nostoc sp. FACHB-133]